MAQNQSENMVWLTQEAYDRLALELEQLTTVGRAEVAKRIEVAREEGDLKENGGYHAAKDDQAKMEGRIRNLTDMLKHAIVGDHPASSGVVEPGTVVTAHIHGDEEKFLLGSRELAGDTDLDVYSEQSPLGQAITGLKIGESSTYTAPNGAEIAVEILNVETFIP
ncbi:transcription elongation factor GreA [Pontimonas sp.]|jgi:transcription elongation factor GreA|nr:transcription elongation factor GreA [Microbacteriaceae bacterium]MDA9786650.1 transcription elongation factor GreA [Pontimonas sp.]